MTAWTALTQARALIADPACWTKSAPYRTGTGANVRKPVMWTGTGALMHVTGKRSGCAGIPELCAAVGVKDSAALGRWEDRPETTHAEVLAAFDRALV